MIPTTSDFLFFRWSERAFWVCTKSSLVLLSSGWMVQHCVLLSLRLWRFWSWSVTPWIWTLPLLVCGTWRGPKIANMTILLPYSSRDLLIGWNSLGSESTQSMVVLLTFYLIGLGELMGWSTLRSEEAPNVFMPVYFVIRLVLGTSTRAKAPVDWGAPWPPPRTFVLFILLALGTLIG